jgi:excisionase family DNA binding protein
MGLYASVFSEISKEGKRGVFMSEDKLFSVKDAAAFLGGLSPYTVAAWLSQGRLRRTKVGSRTMIRESELQRVIEDGGKSPAAGWQGMESR